MVGTRDIPVLGSYTMNHLRENGAFTHDSIEFTGDRVANSRLTLAYYHSNTQTVRPVHFLLCS